MATNSQIINFCFTINNYTVEEEFLLLFMAPPISYMIWGYEKGENETPHLQGYAEMTHRQRLTQIKKIPGFERAHIEARKGTQKQAIDYCKKDGDYFDIGKPKVYKQGQRNDLDDVREAARTKGMKEVSCWANYQQIRTAEKYLQYNEPKRTWKPTVIWLHGATGTGKSRMANTMYPDAYTKADASKWWDGYDGQEAVIMDDYRDNWMSFNELLTLIDRYERRVEFKGGSRQFLATTIVITCHVHPKDLYQNVETERKDQLLRRIDIIEQMGLGTEVGGNTVGPDSDTPNLYGHDEGTKDNHERPSLENPQSVGLKTTISHDCVEYPHPGLGWIGKKTHTLTKIESNDHTTQHKRSNDTQREYLRQ